MKTYILLSSLVDNCVRFHVFIPNIFSYFLKYGIPIFRYN